MCAPSPPYPPPSNTLSPILLSFLLKAAKEKFRLKRGSGGETECDTSVEIFPTKFPVQGQECGQKRVEVKAITERALPGGQSLCALKVSVAEPVRCPAVEGEYREGRRCLLSALATEGGMDVFAPLCVASCSPEPAPPGFSASVLGLC